jgi:hypothetical protein
VKITNHDCPYQIDSTSQTVYYSDLLEFYTVFPSGVSDEKFLADVAAFFQSGHGRRQADK